MPSAKRTELYIGKSIADLNKLAGDIPKVNSVRLFIKSACKLYQTAEQLDGSGDEEKAYVLYMKFFNIVSAVKKLAEFKKDDKYFKEMIGQKRCMQAITQAEKLAESLKNRYDEHEAEEVSAKIEQRLLDKEKREAEENAAEAKKTGEEGKKKEENGEKSQANGQAEATTSPGSVSSERLYGMLQNIDLSLLLVDIRPLDQYHASHINNASCISVPADTIIPGCTVKQIEKALPEESKALWQERSNVDYVVLVDWQGRADSMPVGSTLKSLKDALYKWEVHNRLKHEPLVLEGGYDDWLLFYPTLTTNARVSRPPSNNPLTSAIPSLESIDYDVELNFLKPPEELSPPEGTNDDAQDPPSLIQSPPTNQNRAPISSIPSFDRSTKPQAAPSNNRNVNLFEKDSVKPNNITRKDYPKQDISEVKISNKLDELKDLLEKGKQEVPTKDTNITKQGTVEIPKPAYSRSLKPAVNPVSRQSSADTVESSPEHLSSSSGHQSEADRSPSPEKRESDAPQEPADLSSEQASHLQTENRRLVLEHRARLAKLNQEKEQMHSLRELKSREVQETADLMRAKKGIQQEIQDLEELLATKEKQMADYDMTSSREMQEQISGERERQQVQEEAERQMRDKNDLEAAAAAAAAASAKQKLEAVELAKRQREEDNQKSQKAKEEQERRIKELMDREKRERELKEHQEKLAKEKADRERAERERVDRERAEKEKTDRETAERARAEQDRLAKEKAEQQRVERERAEQERKRQLELANSRKQQPHSGAPSTGPTKDEGPSKLITPGLPVGWEKRLHSGTGRYYYIDHHNQKTTWEPPQVHSGPSQGSQSTTYKTKLKDESNAASSGLKRSHSSPNIAKLVEDEAAAARNTVPSAVDRGSKPKPRMSIQPITIHTEVSAAKVRNLQPTWGSVGRGLTGLRNMGNTCYMNSIIQSLSNTQPLTTYLLSDIYRQDINRKNIFGKGGEVAEEFAVVIKALWSAQYKSITPRDFKNTVAKFHELFAGYEQQDSQELLLFLMDGLHEDLNRVKRRPTLPGQENDGVPDAVAAERAWKMHKVVNESIIVELFQGQFKSTMTCLTCNYKSVTFDAFMYLSLPISSSTRCSLKDCVLHFSKEEKMEGEHKWECPKCKRLRDAVKRIVIWKVPPILLIHLKRFYFQGMWRQKITAFVDYPLEDLDMNKYVEGPKERSAYNLYAVSNHTGTLDGGHYTALCRNPNNKRWFKYDDHEVYEVSKSDIKTSAGYMLFYTSIDMKPLFT